MRRLALLALLAGCEPAAPPAAELPFLELGAFEYKEKMKLPETATRWHAKTVRATGFINPTAQARDLTAFFLVKDRASCCFGKRPQTNHYIDVKLRAGQKIGYTTDPVTVQGVLQVEERWDGDWPLGLYWMENAEVVK
jgi:hypothetical protein